MRPTNMIRPTNIIAILIVAVLLILGSAIRAEVYVNILWDEPTSSFKVMPLVLDGGVTFNRGYQNAYGEEMGYDPGPPFHIQSSILATSSISFEAGGFDPFNPFVIDVRPSEDHVGYISGNGVNFVGTTLDPIRISGSYKIYSGVDYQVDGPNMTWSHTTFRCTYHTPTNNLVPFAVSGCGLTIDQCRFTEYASEFTYLLGVFDFDGVPHYDVVISNSTFEFMDFDGATYPIILRDLNSVSIENCTFDSLTFNYLDYAGLADIRRCGVRSIKNNTGRRNTLNKLHLIDAWAEDSAYIKSSDDMPITANEIVVDFGNALAIGPGSVIKFYHQGGFENSGRLYMDSVVLTSYEDDSHGGDTDVKPQPRPITSQWKTTHGWGINNRFTGELSMKDTKVLYAWVGINAENGFDVEGCSFIDCKKYGMYIDGGGADTFRVANTEILRTLNDGDDAGIHYRHDVGSPQLLDLDSVTIMSTGGPGINIPYIEYGTARIEMDWCRIIDNDGYGIFFASDPTLLGFTVRNSIIAGNYSSGIYAQDQYYQGREVHIEGNVIVGNGHGQLANHRHGLHLPNSPPKIVGNTIAYNAGVGLSYYDIDSIGQTEVTNNVFLRNGDYGLAKTDVGEHLLASNALWENGDEELRYRGPDGTFYTVEELQALGGEFATNLHLAPDLVPERFGVIDNTAYDDHFRISRLVDAEGHFPNYDLVGRFLCPDTADPHWYYITQQVLDTLFIVGDISGNAGTGDVYRIYDFHMAGTSPLLDVGHHASVAVSKDIDGDNRHIDGDEDGYVYVDIGADEYDPHAGEEPPIRVTFPTGGEFFGEDSSCTITWVVDGVSNVHLIYLSEPDIPQPFWDTLSKNIDASLGTHDWEVPPDLTMKGTIRIEDASDPNVFAVSNPFVVKGNVLARKSADSSLVRYYPENDGWRFGNFAAMMWPASWYNQIDYENGVDPYTQRVYPPFFANALFYNAKSSDFPSWPTFVGAFGEDQCYMDGPQGKLYRTEALTLWSDAKQQWMGSCFGFAASTALAFFDSTAFLADYPEVGVFADLHDLDTTSARREVINRLFCHQRGAGHKQHNKANIRNTPRQTLAELKKMFGENYVNGRTMAIGMFGPGGGGHAVTPYALDPDASQAGRYKVWIYDSEFPPPDIPTHYDSLFIDSVANTWSSTAYAGWSGIRSFCFLMDSSASYLDPPVLPGLENSGGLPVFASASAGSIEVCHNGLTTLFVEDGSGNLTGFDKTSYSDEIPGAVPMMTLAGGGEILPDGFVLPDGGYDLTVASSNPVVSTTIWDIPIIYRYSRSGVDSSQTDRMHYDTSLIISNADTGAKQCQVACLTLGADEEKQYVAKNLSLDNGESMEFFTPDGLSFTILNGGTGKLIDMELWSVSTGGGIYGEVTGVTLPGGALSTVAPNWSEPSLTDIELWIDYDADGFYDDTLRLDVVTAVGEENGNVLPYQFTLSQNYPNPFNPVTNIEYSLPERSHVTIEVYNVLGQRVRTLVDREESAGSYSISWNGTTTTGKPAATGVYLYRFRAGDYEETRKMLLLK